MTNGEHIVVAVGLIGSENYVDPAFQRSKGKELTKSAPLFGPQNPALGGAKIFGDPVQNMFSQGSLAVQLIANILRSWHWASGI